MAEVEERSAASSHRPASAGWPELTEDDPRRDAKPDEDVRLSIGLGQGQRGTHILEVITNRARRRTGHPVLGPRDNLFREELGMAVAELLALGLRQMGASELANGLQEVEARLATCVAGHPDQVVLDSSLSSERVTSMGGSLAGSGTHVSAAGRLNSPDESRRTCEHELVGSVEQPIAPGDRVAESPLTRRDIHRSRTRECDALLEAAILVPQA